MENGQRAGSFPRQTDVIVFEIENDPLPGEGLPLHEVTEFHASKFHDLYDLQTHIEKDVFIRGVLALRSQLDIEAKFDATIENEDSTDFIHQAVDPTKIELRLGEHRYTRLESQILYTAWKRSNSKWKTLKSLSAMHRLLIVACIYAAMTQGWDQAAMAGAATSLLRDLNVTETPNQLNTLSNCPPAPRGSSWPLGLITGIPFFTGAILGLILTDPVTTVFRFGRRGAICLAGVFSFISVIGSGSVHCWHHLVGFRVLLGAGMAGKASIVPILLSETSPKNVRGVLLAFWQLFVAFGLAAGSIANLSMYRLDLQSSWRYMFIAAFIPALLLLSLILFSPESPRWLLKESGASQDSDAGKLRRRKLVKAAFKSLCELRGEPVPILAAGEIFLMHKRLHDEQERLEGELSKDPSSGATWDQAIEPIKHISWLDRVRLMFVCKGPTRRAHLAAAAVMISQQLCGINLLALLSDKFFDVAFGVENGEDSEDNGKRKLQLLGITAGLMTWNFIATIPALNVIDKTHGRRRLLNWSFPCMALSLLAAASVLKSDKEASGRYSTAAIAWHYIFLFAFVGAYSIGEGPAAFVISAEVFPLVNRELGMSLAVCWNFLGAGTLAMVATRLLESKLQPFGVLMLFAGTNLVAWFLCYWLVPQTGNEDLEDVFKQLDQPTKARLQGTLKDLLQKVTRPLDYAIGLGNKRWSDCGYGGRDNEELEMHLRSV